MLTLILSIVIFTSHLAPPTTPTLADCKREYESRMAYFAELEAQGGVSAKWLRESRRIAKENYEACKKRNPRNAEGGAEW